MSRCLPFFSTSSSTFPEMANGAKKPPPVLSSSDNDDHRTCSTRYTSLYTNPLTDPSDKENAAPPPSSVPCNGINSSRKPPFKPNSLHLCMHSNEPHAASPMEPKLWDPPSSSCEAWEQLSDTEAAPASSWATLPNKSLLCRPLPLDVGRCTCIIDREKAQELKGVYLYSLYTNEGQGRQDRKLAVARHVWHNGRSEFVVALKPNGVFNRSDESFLGSINANLVGSKYQLWGKGSRVNSLEKRSRRLLGAVRFLPTIRTWTGSYRTIRAWIPKHQSMQLKNTSQVHTIGDDVCN